MDNACSSVRETHELRGIVTKHPTRLIATRLRLISKTRSLKTNYTRYVSREICYKSYNHISSSRTKMRETTPRDIRSAILLELVSRYHNYRTRNRPLSPWIQYCMVTADKTKSDVVCRCCCVNPLTNSPFSSENVLDSPLPLQYF